MPAERSTPQDCPAIAARPSPPVLLLLKGQPGSGKSTLGRAAAAALGWPLVDKDDARSPFQPLVAANQHIDWNQLSYDVMFRYAETQLACGLSLLVDCPLARRALFDRAAALANKYGARLALVELEPGDPQLWRQRIERRGERDRGTHHEHKPGSWEQVQAVLARNGGSEDWSAAADISIELRCRLDSTGTSAQQQLQAVLQLLRRGGALQDAAASEGAAAAAGCGSRNDGS